VKRRGMWRDRRAISPVISSILLCATVLAVGASVWSFSYNAGTMLRQNYCREVGQRVDGLRERFIIENIIFNSTGNNTMRIWVYNCGTINIKLTAIHVFRSGSVVHSETFEESVTIPIKGISEISFTTPVNSGEDLVIQAVSERGNKAFEAYRVP